MNHKMHDGPADDYMIRSGRIIKPSRPRVSLAALQWDVDRANQSYGTFTMHLRPEDESRIQIEYNEFILQRNAAAVARRTESAEDIPAIDEYIITDEDI